MWRILDTSRGTTDTYDIASFCYVAKFRVSPITDLVLIFQQLSKTKLPISPQWLMLQKSINMR
jgi:hypothetical protein